MGAGHSHDVRTANRRALGLALGITAAFTAIEVAGGVLTGSLAVLADAVHMLSDNLSLALALFASWLAGRPSTTKRTYGYERAEVLAALANGVLLVALAVWIFVEAARRLSDPPEVLGGWMLAIGVAGVCVNLAAGAVLWRSREHSLNVEAAFRHVGADLLGSVGIGVAAIVVLATGWLQADPLVSILIGVLVLASSWGVLRDATTILLEASPKEVDTSALGARLAGAPGVVEVHDLHVWTITSGFPSLSAHVLVGAGEDCHQRRRELEHLLHEEFGIEHTTLQVEHAAPSVVELRRFGEGRRG